ncbi:MAG: fibronectin type III domain-containing protein [Verrucomicrobiota bacterium]|jgi:hypothetical protein
MMRATYSRHGWGTVAGRRAILSFAMVLGLALCPWSRAAQSVTLAWNPSTASGVAGYMIHYGNDGTNYSNEVDAGTNTRWNVTGLQEGDTNYFVVTAYDVNHVESTPSNQTIYYVPGVTQMTAGVPPPGKHKAIEASGSRLPTLNFPVAPGQTYQVQASTDLQNWVTIWQTTASTNGWIEYQDPEAVNLTMRFYRTLAN